MTEGESGTPGLSLDAIKRLHYLKEMGKQLEARGADPDGMIPYLVAIIAA